MCAAPFGPFRQIGPVPFFAAHATSLILQWQVVGVDADFGHDMTVVLAGQTAGPFTAGQTINFRTAASNSTVTTSIKSAVKTVTLT